MSDTFDIAVVRRLHRQVGDRLEQSQADRRRQGQPTYTGASERHLAKAITGDVVREYTVAERMSAGHQPLEPEEERRLCEAVFARMYGAGRLQQLLDDETIEDININGPDEVFVLRTGGVKERVAPVAESDEELIELIQTLAAYSGLNARPFDAANPQLDLRLPDGSRLSATQSVCAHPAISIRRNRFEKVQLADMVGNDTVTEQLADFLLAAIRARFNIMIAGATGAGKTTMLRALASEIGPEERIITVEKSLELSLRDNPERHPDCVEFEERVANSEDRGAVPVAELVRRCLRMSPDRVIVGEVLGPEIITMLNAMTQGNDGSLSTIHARNAYEVFNRINTYALQAEERMPREATRSLIAGGLDFVLFMRKDRATGQRRLTTVLEINGDTGDGIATSEIFTTGPGGNIIFNPGVTDVMRADDLRAAGWTTPSTEGWNWT